MSPRSEERSVPGSSRSLRSVVKRTITSPRMPCGFVTKPTSSNSLIDEVDVDLGAILGGGGTHHGADGVGHATTPADHATHVARADRHLERGAAPAFGRLDPNGVGVVDQL